MLAVHRLLITYVLDVTFDADETIKYQNAILGIASTSLSYRPVVDSTTIAAAIQSSDASTAAIAVLRVMSAGFGVNILSSSNICR